VRLAPTETQELVRNTARELAQRTVLPKAAEIDQSGEFPRDTMRALAELGLMAVNVPPELGGAGAGAVALALAIEEVARACASTAVMMSVTNMVGETIARFGSDRQRREHCPKLANGDHVLGSFALSEPDAGSDPGALRTVARREGTGWVIDGAKQWITGGTYAGVLLVWARTGTAASGTRGLSCFIVEGGARGLKPGRPEHKMGIVASNTVSIELDGCRVGSHALLGAENGGFKIAMAALDGGRLGVAAQALGIARAAMAETVRYAQDRKAFGVPIAEHQAVRFKLADMATHIDAAALLLMRAAWLKDSGRPFTREASMAKLVSSEAAVRVCEEAVQIHGGYGYIRDFAVERHFRDARVTPLYEGTSEIQRLVIARHLLAG
jgi:alkylation response protein AidB-like acyl-CoA dehydrogenase